MRPRGPMGVPALIDFEDESVETYGDRGARRIFRARRCSIPTPVCVAAAARTACPATASGKHLNPKAAIQDLRAFMGRRERPRAGGVIVGSLKRTSGRALPAGPAKRPVRSSSVTWIRPSRCAATSCSWKAGFPPQARLVFDNLEVNGNPLGESAPHPRRLPSYAWGFPPSPREPGGGDPLLARLQRQLSTSETRRSRLLWFDSWSPPGSHFATLGNEEKCCGEPARRLGNEYLFQSLASQNIGVMSELRGQEDRHPVPALLPDAQERVSAAGR